MIKARPKEQKIFIPRTTIGEKISENDNVKNIKKNIKKRKMDKKRKGTRTGGNSKIYKNRGKKISIKPQKI